MNEDGVELVTFAVQAVGTYRLTVITNAVDQADAVAFALRQGVDPTGTKVSDLDDLVLTVAEFVRNPSTTQREQ